MDAREKKRRNTSAQQHSEKFSCGEKACTKAAIVDESGKRRKRCGLHTLQQKERKRKERERKERERQKNQPRENTARESSFTDSPRAHSEGTSYLRAAEKLTALEKITDPSASPDTSKPSHWATGGLLPLSGRKLWAIIMKDLSQGDQTFYRSGSLANPLGKDSRNDFLSYIAHPEPEDPGLIWVSNIAGRSNEIWMEMPEVIQNGRHYDEEATKSYSSNITPRGTVVELHRDPMDVFSVCTNAKLWFFFPPTEHNIECYWKEGKSFRKLLRLVNELQGGFTATSSKDEGLWIPCGWFHATVALENSITIGVTLNSAESLSATTKMLCYEMRLDVEMVAENQSDIVYFLQSLSQAFCIKKYSDCKEALSAVCPRKLSRPLTVLKVVKGHQKKILMKCMEVIEAGIAASARDGEIWECEEDGCGELLRHIPLN